MQWTPKARLFLGSRRHHRPLAQLIITLGCKTNMNSNYHGVFFVDIIGMGSLTRGELDLTDIHMPIDETISTAPDSAQENHYLAAYLLTKFRKILIETKTNYPSLKLAQLSDCAFIWSKNFKELFLFSCQFMNNAVKNGVFCRAGIASGDVIESPGKGEEIGKFIVGSAVTQAVKIETLGKGCRIFTDPECAHYILNEFPKSRLIHFMIKEEILPTDFTLLDEIKWYLLYNYDSDIDLLFTSTKSFQDSIFKTLTIATYLQYSPMFAWNSANSQGRTHLAASIESITSSLDLILEENPYKLSAYTIKDYLIKNRKNFVLKNRLLSIKKDIKNIKLYKYQ